MKAALALFAALSVACTSSFAQDVSVQGSTEIAFGLMMPRKADIERMSGQTLRIVSTSSSRGLSALVAGNADIALLAEPLHEVIDGALRVAPGSVDASKLESFHVANAEARIIVNAANPVNRLDDRQVAGLFGGRIANWKEVGGPDLAVLVVTEPTSSPHLLLQKHFAFAMSPRSRSVQNAAQTVQVVAQMPGAISYFSADIPMADRERVRAVATQTRVPMTLHVAIRKDAPAGVRRVVDAARQLGGPF